MGEYDDRLPCPTCKASGFVLSPDEASASSTVATSEDGVARTQGDLAEELEFLAKAIEDVLKTIDLEAERFGKLEIHQKWGKTDWPRVARWLRERITAQAGATEIRRLRARVAELETENGALKDLVEDMDEELDIVLAIDMMDDEEEHDDL